MTQNPSMPLFVDAYMADTMHLSEAEDGVYMRLLMCMWRMGGTLPNDDDRLARFVRVSKRKWQTKYRPILEAFFTITETVWTQKRLQKEWKYVTENAERSRANGAKGGRPKSLEKNKTQNPTGSFQVNPDGTQAISPQPQPHKETEPNGSAKKVSRGIRIPDAWAPSQDNLDFARDVGLTRAEAEAEAAKFRDYWISQPGQRGVKLDWDATWRNWVRKASEGRKVAKHKPKAFQAGSDELARAYDQ